MFCENCGKENPEGVKFCAACGAKQEMRQESAEPIIADIAVSQTANGEIESSNVQIAPLGLGQLIDLGIKLYFKNFKTIVTTAAIALAPCYLLIFAAEFLVSGNTGAGELPFFDMFYLISLGCYLLAFMVAMPLQQGAIINIVSNIYMGKEHSIKKGYSAAAEKLGALILGGIFYILASGLGTILCVLPGLYLFIAMLLYPYVIMLEDMSSSKALSRSIGLVKGSWFKLFLVIMLVGIASMVIVGMQLGLFAALAAFSSIGTIGAAYPFINLLTNLLNILIIPLGVVITILFYYDLRVRKEGYDIELMARDILK